MKRGDTIAIALYLLQAALALGVAAGMTPVVPGLGDHYFTVPLWPLQEALSDIRTLGYPVFHGLMARFGGELSDYPPVQMAILIVCTAFFAFGLRRYGLTGMTALVGASPLLWVVPVEVVMPETLAKCFAIAATGCLLWATGTRRRIPFLFLAVTLFCACQMRPAFLFLLVYLPLLWAILYARRWGFQAPRKAWRSGFACMGACTLPLLLFCLLRLVVVGHFGLVSFGGQNTVGISVEMIRPDSVQALPMEDQPLAMLMARTREGWPTPRFLHTPGWHDDWRAVSNQYAVNVNRIARAVQAKFPPVGGAADNVAQDKALSRMSQHIFLHHAELYAGWLSQAIVEGSSLAVDLLLGGHGGMAFGWYPEQAIAFAIALLLLVVFSWPLERRAFGEGSRAYSGGAVSVLLLVAGLFFLLKMLLVILVEPPIPRYVQAALFLFPSVIMALCWTRLVVFAAALARRPYWYGQCLVAYPAVPDAPQPLAWQDTFARWQPRRSVAITLALLVVLLATVGWYRHRDVRFFETMERNPEHTRELLLASDAYNSWRAPHGATVLHYAARLGDEDLVAHLLHDPSLRERHTHDGATPLHWAAMESPSSGVIDRLLAEGLSPEAPGPLGLSALHLAALFGNDAALRPLLSADVNPDVKTVGHIAPLHLARTPETARLLLEMGATIDVPDGNQATPFMWAHTEDLAHFFLEAGADINAAENWRSFIRQATPLHKAVYQDDLDRARWLLEAGADPNRGDLNEFSPLFYALWRNNPSMIALLLAHGADIHHGGKWVRFDREHLDFRYTDIYGKTIGRHPARDTFKHLVEDQATLRPLDWAAFLGNPPLIELLLERGADPARHNEAGMSALHWALLGHRGKAVRLMRAAVPDPTVWEDERLPLHSFESAVREGRPTAAPVEVLPAPTAPSPHAALEARAQQIVEEYNNGAPNVLEGANGFLFTRQAAQYLLQRDLHLATPGDPASGPSPALASIVDIHQQLQARGIHLIVVPAPMAIETHVDSFLPTWDSTEAPFPPRREFIAALQEGGVDAVDLLPAFMAHRTSHPEAHLYLEGDGHWNSTAIAIAAKEIARRIPERDGAGRGSVSYQRAVVQHPVGIPYLAHRLPEQRRSAYDGTQWAVTRILQADGTPYTDDDESSVLVAGDSYTLMFNELAGHLSAHLAAELGLPVASHLGNAAGPIIPRVLARKGKAYIDRRQVIIWVFSAAYIRPSGKDKWGILALP